MKRYNHKVDLSIEIVNDEPDSVGWVDIKNALLRLIRREEYDPERFEISDTFETSGASEGAEGRDEEKMKCLECAKNIDGTAYHVFHNETGTEVGRLCEPCESVFSQDGFNTADFIDDEEDE